MPYQLVPTREEDVQRVLSDVACSEEHHTRVVLARNFGEVPTHWALEPDTGNYLVGLRPNGLRPENLAECYLFVFGGAMFEIAFENIFSETVKIQPLCGAAIEDVSAFREQLTRAFAAHGRYGRPDLPSHVIPQFAN